MPPDDPNKFFQVLGDALKVITLQPNTPATVVIRRRLPRVRLVGMFFDLNKSFLLPSAMPGIRRIAQLYDQHRASNLLVVGHTDTSGEDDFNLTLSLERADSLSAYLINKVDAWEASFHLESEKKRWGIHEIQLMLSVLPADSSTKFFVGEPTDVKDAQTDTAIRAFQQANKKLEVDGDPGTKTRKALILDYMSIHGTTLPADDDITLTAHGCGENFPVDKTGDDVRDPDNRRVEVFFFDGPITPPPPGRVSKAGSTEYPRWLAQLTETEDIGVDFGKNAKKLTLRMLRDGKEPLANRRFRLEVLGEILTDVTGADGVIETEVPETATGGTLTFLGKAPDGKDTELWKIELVFADIPPANTTQGAQVRLANVGLFPGREDGQKDERTERAIRRFQQLLDIPQTGTIDTAADATTVQKLQEYYGS